MSRLARGNIVVIAGLAVAGSVFVAALFRAFTVEPARLTALEVAAPIGEAVNAPASTPLSTPSQTVVSREEIAYAVAHDPFQPDREQPEPYRFPDELRPEPTPAERVPPPAFRMTGVVGMAEGGLVLIETDGMTPQVLAIGESILGYRLERVEEISATLVGHGQTVELLLAHADPHPGGDGSTARPFRLPAISVGGFRGNSADVIQRVIQQAQQAGMSAERIQALLQSLTRQGIIVGGPVPRVTIRRDVPDAPSRAPDNR